MENKTQNVSLTLPVAGVQLILQALVEQPYKVVAGVVHMVQEQANADLDRQAANANQPAVVGAE